MPINLQNTNWKIIPGFPNINRASAACFVDPTLDKIYVVGGNTKFENG